MRYRVLQRKQHDAATEIFMCLYSTLTREYTVFYGTKII